MESIVAPELEPTDTDIRITPPQDQAPYVGLDGKDFHGMVKENNAWDVYNNEARKVDNELVKDWTASLNFLLVFAAIFSAVLAAFIIESKRLLEPDYNALIVDIMVFYANSIARGVHDVYTPPTFQPANSSISINCLLFGSLAASLVAALASVVALQWVADFDAVITRGGSSPEDRAKRRQFRFAGVVTWKMGGIIAALPLLLYFSVVLFFVGIIQWMLILNAMVGYVVIGGASIVALFYFSSTILAVLFVSAPFKTPLSRWIYATYHFPFAIIHWMVSMAPIYEGPQWVRKRWQAYLTAHKREDSAVESRADLRYQAMHWLAAQVSISEDSRRRLLLLVNQLLAWPPAQFGSREFTETPWIPILNFLAQRHKNALQSQIQTREEEQELALLANCAALSGLRPFLLPTERHDYDSNVDSDTYWSQYCITTDRSLAPLWREFTDLVEPEVIFLITRDLPVPSLLTVDEMEITLRLAKWRNSRNKPLETWQAVFSTPRTFSDDFFNSCITILSRYLTANAHRQSYILSRGVLGRIILDITQKAAASGISSIALTALVRSFEAAMFVRDEPKLPYRSSSACLQRPLYYGHRLQLATKEELLIHRKLVLLLARDIQGLPDSEHLRRLGDLLAMVWAIPSEQIAFSLLQDPRWDNLANKYGQTCQLEALKQEIDHDWILYADRSDDVTAMIVILTQISPNGSQIGLRALSSCSRRSIKHMFALLRLFENLLHADPQRASPTTILKSLCRVLQMYEDGMPREHGIPSSREFSVYAFKAPYFRAIAYRALGIEHIDEVMTDQAVQWSELTEETTRYMFWNMSIQDAQSLWQLRAWLIFDSSGHNFCDLVTRLLEDALRRPTSLLQLERILAEQTRCSHQQGQGHLLRHLQSAIPPSILFRSDKRLFEGISLKNLKLPPITALLAISSIDDLPLLGLPQQIDRECMEYLWGCIDSLKTSQSATMAFLIELQLYHSPAAKWGSFAIFLKAIEESIALPPEDHSIPIFVPLSKRVLDLPRLYYEFLSQRDETKWRAEITALIVHGQRISDLALSRLSTVSITGQRNQRLLSCARPLWGTRPAIGWWLCHE